MTNKKFIPMILFSLVATSPIFAAVKPSSKKALPRAIPDKSPPKKTERDKEKEDVKEKRPIPATTTSIDYDENEKTESTQESIAVERILRNPILAGGLNSGADAINRSINSLMSSLFYKLMDNEFRYPLTGSANIMLGFNRDVYTAENGAWVVVDRFGMGPEYGKELYRYNDIPVSLGASQKSEIFDIYLRTDPMRVSDNKKLPMWRVALNNWFGILPILETILPPAFNANEMYDPLRRLEAPFTFPLSVDSFEGMETGSIKSYSINGGVNLGVEISQGIHGYKDVITAGASGVGISIPYTIFRTGEYRVNVLKKDLNTAWVGITDATRIGHRIENHFGTTYYLLSKTVPLWTGMPAPVLPVNFSVEEAVGDVFSRVYSFDLREEEAKKSYLEAVHGNLAPAQLSWLRAREDKLKTGVGFFYNKKEKRYETSYNAGPNVFLVNNGTKRTHSDAEIEITDRDGKFYILEARQDRDTEDWNMLTGSEIANYSAIADLRVRKVIERNAENGDLTSRYEFVADPNPVDVSLSLQIIDKYVETEDLMKYIDQLSRFTRLSLVDEVPKIPTRDYDLESKRRKQVAFTMEIDAPTRLHVTPTHLGSFEGYAAIRMTANDLTRIANLPREELWAAFCEAFDVAKARCATWQESTFSRNIDRSAGWAILPLKVLDMNFPRLEAVDEIENALRALKGYAASSRPEPKRDYLRKLFSTAFPLELAEALLTLSDADAVPRSVQLTTNPKGNGPDEAKSLFKRLDGKRFRGGPKFPPPARYDTTIGVENNFNPANLSFSGVKPRIRKLSLFKEEVASKNTIRSTIGDYEVPVLAVRLYGSRMDETKEVHVYVRLEQTGKVQLAKFKLIEEVLEVPTSTSGLDFTAGRLNFLLRLSGGSSPIANMLSSEAFGLGGSFKLTLALSVNGVIWSDEKSLEFRIDDGRLLPIGE